MVHKMDKLLKFLFKSFLNKFSIGNYLSKSKNNVAHHYDLSDRLYELFLDKDRQYSCAYFNSPNDTLGQAQTNKKELIATITSRPLECLIDNKKLIVCYLDYMCVEKNRRKILLYFRIYYKLSGVNHLKNNLV